MNAPGDADLLIHNGIDRWEEELYLSCRRRARIAYLIAGIAGLISVLSVSAVMLLTPLKTVAPIVITVDKNTGLANVSSTLGELSLSDDEAVTQSLLFRYTRDRETYAAYDHKGRLEAVFEMFQGSAASDLQELYKKENPNNPMNIYGSSGLVSVENIVLESSHLHVWLTPNNDETKQKLLKILGNQTITQKSISGKAWSSKSSDSRSESWSEKGRELLTPEEIGRLGKEEVIITGKGMFPIRTHRVTWFQEPGFLRFYNEQKSVPWPKIPIVKHGIATTFDEFMRDVNARTRPENAPSQFADMPPDNPAKPSLILQLRLVSFSAFLFIGMRRDVSCLFRIGRTVFQIGGMRLRC